MRGSQDIHVVGRDEFVLAVVVLFAAGEIFGLVEPVDADEAVFGVFCFDFADLRNAGRWRGGAGVGGLAG